MMGRPYSLGLYINWLYFRCPMILFVYLLLKKRSNMETSEVCGDEGEFHFIFNVKYSISFDRKIIYLKSERPV